jgi:SAM-dependent methyltransferase
MKAEMDENKENSSTKQIENQVGFWDFQGMGRVQWRGQTSPLKGAYFLLLGTPDMHTRLRNSYVINLIESLDLPAGSRVMDAGCGRAVASFWLARKHPDWEFTGVELDPVLSRPLKRTISQGGWTNMTVVEEDINNLDMPGQFDLIFTIDMMEHIEDDVGLLRQFRAALKPGGRMVIHVPRRRQEQWRLLPFFRAHTVDTHVRNEYSADELRSLMESAGFEVTHLRETIGPWGEVAFELNQLFWPWVPLRYLMATLTYLLAIPFGYVDIAQNPSRGNSLMIAGVKPS